jgi:hypothetical protein
VLEHVEHLFIPLDVAGYLLQPEFSPGLRHLEEMAPMSMPEASVNEYNCSVARKHQIGTTGQVPLVKAETQSPSMEATAEE